MGQNKVNSIFVKINSKSDISRNIFFRASDKGLKKVLMTNIPRFFDRSSYQEFSKQNIGEIDLISFSSNPSGNHTALVRFVDQRGYHKLLELSQSGEFLTCFGEYFFMN